jgi:hypothetical protein
MANTKIIKSRSTRCARHVVRMGGGKKPLGRPRRRLEENIKMYIWEIELDSVEWIYVAQNRDQWRAVVNTVMNPRFP